MNTAVDMSAFIAPKSDQLNADDLIGGPRTITITRVTGNEGNAEQPVNVFFEGDDGKPFRPCKSMRRVMVAVWGADASKYAGRSMTIFRDPKVKWGGMEVGGIRISHMTGLDAPKQMALTETRAKRTPYTVKPLSEKEAAAVAKGDDLGEWAHRFIASVGRASSLDKLDAGVAKVQDKIDDLAEQIPDAHAAVMKAIEDKRASFGSDDDDPFADDQPDSVNYAPFVEGIEKRIAAAETTEDLDAIADDIDGADHVPEAEKDALEVKLARKRRAIGKAK